MPNRYDVSIDGTRYRLIRGEESYQQGASRSMIDLQEIETMAGSQFTSREDLRALFQTSWAGGSRWEKPILSNSSIDTYFKSSDFDMLVEPGSLLPKANKTYPGNSVLMGHSKWVQARHNVVYAIGHAGSTNYNVYRWDGAVSYAGNSGIPKTETPLDMCWSEADGHLYMISTAGVTATDPNAQTHKSVASIPGGPGSSVFIHEGELVVYDGTKVQRIVDPLGTPVVSTVFDDGYGQDWLTHISHSATNRYLMPWSNEMAISTSDGIHYVKNVAQGGTVMAYIYRIDRDAGGTDIGTPIATLEPGYLALDIYWSLGSLLVSATSDVGRLGANNADEPAPRVEFFHLTNNALGAIGVPVGNNPDEFVFKMMFAQQRTIYLGGHRNVWAYDPVRGGLHMLHSADLEYGHFHSAFATDDGPGIAHGDNHTGQMVSFLPYSNETEAGIDAFVESNYFDFSLPGETKYVTEVTLMVDDIQVGETWTVSLEADDGTWLTVAKFEQGATQKKVFTAPVPGYRFRYKLEYATALDQATPSKVKGIMFRSLSGEMVPFWSLTIDGTEAFNVENEIVRPMDVFDSLVELRDTKRAIEFIDNYEADDRSHASTYRVRVHGVTIIKEEPKESVIKIVLAGT